MTTDMTDKRAQKFAWNLISDERFCGEALEQQYTEDIYIYYYIDGEDWVTYIQPHERSGTVGGTITPESFALFVPSMFIPWAVDLSRQVDNRLVKKYHEMKDRAERKRKDEDFDIIADDWDGVTEAAVRISFWRSRYYNPFKKIHQQKEENREYQ